MDPSSLVENLDSFLSTPLFGFGAFLLTLERLLLFCVVLGISWVLAREAKRLASRIFSAETEEEAGGSAVAEPVAFWTVMALGTFVALDALGLNVATALSILNEPFFTISGDEPVTPSRLLFAMFVVFLTWILSRVLRRGSSRALRSREVDQGSIAALNRLLHYAVIALGLVLALQNLGVNLGALLAAGAVFAVGFGLAMQSIAQNFVSGVILLMERSIKPGDIIEAEGMVVVVEKMGIRATVARTRDEEEIIIPNGTLAQTSVKNYTLRDSLYRLRAQVGVEYGSNMARVMTVLQDAADAIEWRFKGQEPVVLLTEFGDSSVNFDVSVWMSDPWTAPRHRSQLMMTVWNALKAEEITIAYPQLDVHFDRPVEDAITRLPGRDDVPRAS